MKVMQLTTDQVPSPIFVLVVDWWCVLLLASAAAEVAPPPPIAKPGCSEKCGNVIVPYPFGIDKPSCSRTKDFQLQCNYSTDGGGNDRLWLGQFEITNISVEQGTASTYVIMAYYCYNESIGAPTGNDASVSLKGSPFTFSADRNKFTALGCDTRAVMVDGDGTRFMSGCMSLCYERVNLTKEGNCSGVGCCRTQIPKGIKKLNMSLKAFNGFSYVRDFSPCSFAFLADQDWYDYTRIDLMDTFNDTSTRMSPAVLDWVVGNETCESFSSSSNISSYACGVNTYCNNSYNGPGYLCFCNPGYQGNPYLPQGCQDINECMYPERYACEGKCKNTVGNYTCHCPLGMSGDGKIDCKGFRLSTLAAGGGVMLSVVVIILFVWMECKRRNRARNFHENGGSLLKHQKIMILTEKELKKATKNYDPSQLLGRGGSGSVYKGVLPDQRLVAIKKPNDVDRTRNTHFRHRREEMMNNEFQHEIEIICQVNHTNVVKLLGLCLETNVPLLIYEFVSNGSLFDHIHIKRSAFLNSWKNRLRIACETAVALDYLHSKAGTPIIHRDVKFMNILLDENFTAKVSDFGASVLIPLEQSVINTEVQGTQGYLDPEYLITGNLTLKSDVYSFGVVLMELLTSQKPILNRRSGEKVNFIQNFILSVEQGKLSEVLYAGEFVDPEGEMEQVEVVAELALGCLNRSGVGRPDMTKVAEELKQIQRLHDNLAVDHQQSKDNEDMVSLLGNNYRLHDPADNDHLETTSVSFETQYMSSFDVELQTPSDLPSTV